MIDFIKNYYFIIVVLICMVGIIVSKNNNPPIIYLKDKTIINYHAGGNIPLVMKEISHLKRPIEVKGLCASSCNYVLSFKDTCINRDSRFIFHAPRLPHNMVSVAWTYPMSTWFNDKLQKWFLTTVVDEKDHILSGATLIDDYSIKECGK